MRLKVASFVQLITMLEGIIGVECVVHLTQIKTPTKASDLKGVK